MHAPWKVWDDEDDGEGGQDIIDGDLSGYTDFSGIVDVITEPDDPPDVGDIIDEPTGPPDIGDIVDPGDPTQPEDDPPDVGDIAPPPPENPDEPIDPGEPPPPPPPPPEEPLVPNEPEEPPEEDEPSGPEQPNGPNGPNQPDEPGDEGEGEDQPDDPPDEPYDQWFADDYLSRMQRLLAYQEYGDYGRTMRRAERGPGDLVNMRYAVDPDGRITAILPPEAPEAMVPPTSRVVSYKDLSDGQRLILQQRQSLMEDAVGLGAGQNVAGMPWDADRLGSALGGIGAQVERSQYGQALSGMGLAPAVTQRGGLQMAESMNRAQAMGSAPRSRRHSPGGALLDAIRSGITGYRRY